MNERVVSKMTNFCVVKLSNSPAITCVPRLEPGHFELQPDSLRIDQRLLNETKIISLDGNRYTAPDPRNACKKKQ